jgi:hypothetical protein
MTDSICEFDSQGTTRWFNEEGEFHRLDGPAVVWVNGDKEWYSKDRLHRRDGPAVELLDGTREWWVNGKLHRLDGPAIVGSDHTEEWWVGGKEFTQQEFEQHSLVVSYRLSKKHKK